MLMLARQFGQWIHVTHDASGDVIRILAIHPKSEYPQDVRLGFEDPDHRFRVERPGRKKAEAS